MKDVNVTMLVGLEQVVDKDGTVWWTKPDLAPFYTNLERTYGDFPELREAIDNYTKLYWTHHKG